MLNVKHLKIQHHGHQEKHVNMILEDDEDDEDDDHTVEMV
jgi:hypothetical protein